MKQQILEAENAALKAQVETLTAERDDFKLLYDLHKPSFMDTPKADYNGWPNRATWQANLQIGPYLESMANEGAPLGPEEVKEAIQDHLPVIEEGIVLDIVTDWLAEVDTKELAKRCGWVE